MRALTLDIQESAGRILCCTIFRQGGPQAVSQRSCSER